ncbi:MAG TPA: TonB-dependent receptor [Spirochaetota bacterium]|nr:TonB-dependent receptor [Spirochaetota bacterium]
MKKTLLIFLLAFFLISNSQLYSQETTPLQDETNAEEAKEPGLDTFTVRGTRESTPLSKSINTKNVKTAGHAQNVMELLKNEAILDFRGESDLVSNDDPFFLRGFSGERFVTAIDGLTIRKTGGRKNSNIVDYMLLPPWLIERVEVIPGPHSALYPGKAMGGVVNMITKTPEKHESLIPDMNLSAGYQSYNTQSYNADMNGSVSLLTYDAGIQKYSTDGYLRNDAADILTYFGRAGIIIPGTGFLAVSGSQSKADREIAVNNNSTLSDYDSDYPDVTGSAFSPWQEPTWDKEAYAYRMNSQFDTMAGVIKVTGYVSKENRDRAYYAASGDTAKTSMFTNWWQRAAKAEDEFNLFKGHTTTVEADIEQLYDNGGYGGENHKDKRIEVKGGALQHQWQVTGSFKIIGGIRYEDVEIHITNYNATTNKYYISGRDKWIERNWASVSPKSMFNWDLDWMGELMRDTSLSGGVSRIWHAPDYHGIYNPQGKPAGAWLDPETGVAYDIMIKRRLIGSIDLQCGYSFYTIKDFIVQNSQAKYTPSGSNPVTPGLEYSDYKINLEKVNRHGVDIDLRGDITGDFSFSFSYSFQTFNSRGNEPAGEDAVDQLPRHRIGAGLSYTLPTNTTFTVDYSYESEQVDTTSEEISPDVYTYSETSRDSYQTVDIALTQEFVNNRYFLKNASIKLYINNLFNEDYENAEGYPMTDRTYGGAVYIKI